MKTLGIVSIIFSAMACAGLSGCMVPKDDYEKVSTELANTQQLAKQANDAHLKVAEENRQLQAELRQTQAKLDPTLKELNETKKQLSDTLDTYKREVAALSKKNESLQTQCDDSTAKMKKNQIKLDACESELNAVNKKVQEQQNFIDRQKLIIKQLRKSNAAAIKTSTYKSTDIHPSQKL